MLKLEMDALAVDSFPTAEPKPTDSHVAMAVAQYPVTYGWDCVSCMEGCYYWVDGTV